MLFFHILFLDVEELELSGERFVADVEVFFFCDRKGRGWGWEEVWVLVLVRERSGRIDGHGDRAHLGDGDGDGGENV